MTIGRTQGTQGILLIIGTNRPSGRADPGPTGRASEAGSVGAGGEMARLDIGGVGDPGARGLAGPNRS